MMAVKRSEGKKDDNTKVAQRLTATINQSEINWLRRTILKYPLQNPISFAYLDEQTMIALTTDKAFWLPSFLQELEGIQPLNTEQKENIFSRFSILPVEKDTIILSEGEVCRCLWVVLKGIIRSYHYVGETEVTSRLMKPHHIIISVESFYRQTPAFETLEAVQPSVLACLPYEKLDELYHLFPALNYLGRRLTEHYLFLTEQRLHMLRKQKAIDKYKFFLEQYPNLVNEIPLKYIASYLGINGETLSRVRNKIR